MKTLCASGSLESYKDVGALPGDLLRDHSRDEHESPNSVTMLLVHSLVHAKGERATYYSDTASSNHNASDISSSSFRHVKTHRLVAGWAVAGKL